MDADPKDTEGQLYQAEGYLISRQLYQVEISRFMLTTCNRQYGTGKRTDTQNPWKNRVQKYIHTSDF